MPDSDLDDLSPRSIGIFLYFGLLMAMPVVLIILVIASQGRAAILDLVSTVLVGIAAFHALNPPSSIPLDWLTAPQHPLPIVADNADTLVFAQFFPSLALLGGRLLTNHWQPPAWPLVAMATLATLLQGLAYLQRRGFFDGDLAAFLRSTCLSGLRLGAVLATLWYIVAAIDFARGA